MERLKVKKGLDFVPPPCEVFDMIAGSGTGGYVHHSYQILALLAGKPNRSSRINAILLGRLRMTIDDAIQAFKYILAKAFSGSTWFGTQEFRAKRLEGALRAIVRLKMENGESLMVQPESKCKT